MRQKVTISGASVGALELGSLDAVVTDLAASGLPSVVGGMLGLDFLSKFEADLDFANKTMRFHPRGSIVSGALDVESLVEVPLAMHPTGLKTVACRLNASDAFPGVLDMGSFFSVVNWMAVRGRGRRGGSSIRDEQRDDRGGRGRTADGDVHGAVRPGGRRHGW